RICAMLLTYFGTRACSWTRPTPRTVVSGGSRSNATMTVPPAYSAGGTVCLWRCLGEARQGGEVARSCVNVGANPLRRNVHVVADLIRGSLNVMADLIGGGLHVGAELAGNCREVRSGCRRWHRDDRGSSRRGRRGLADVRAFTDHRAR